MNFAKAKEIALQLIDATESDYDESLYPQITDTAQKMIATQGKRIKRTHTITKTDDTETAYNLPVLVTDFWLLNSVKLRGSIEPVDYYEYGVEEDYNLVITGGGTFDVYYYALPETISETTLDTYEFEVSEETHNAIPYYIGYELTKIDDPTTAQIMKNSWNKYMSLFSDTPKAEHKKINNHYGMRC